MAGKDTDADASRKEGIINHMNREHTRELSNYLRHYNSLSSRQAAKSAIFDISFDTMHIRAGGLNHTVPFDPPLTSWSDARPRLVEMDTAAREALGISDIIVTSYRAPNAIELVVMCSVAFYFFCAGSLPWFLPGTKAWRIVDGFFPYGAAGYRWLVRAIFFPVLGIHLSEAFLFDRWRLGRYSVERWTPLWWVWEMSCFVEGLGAWRRIDRVVADKRAEKESKKSH